MIVLGLLSLFLFMVSCLFVSSNVPSPFSTSAPTIECVETADFPLGYVRRTYYMSPNCLGDPFHETLERTGVCLPLYDPSGTTITGSTVAYLSKDLMNMCPATDDTILELTFEPTFEPTIEPDPTAVPTPLPSSRPTRRPTKQPIATKATTRRLLAERELESSPAANETIYTILRQHFATLNCSGASDDYYAINETTDTSTWIYNGTCRSSLSVKGRFANAYIREHFYAVPDNTTSAFTDRLIPRPSFSFQGMVTEWYINEADCKSPTKSQMPVYSWIYPMGTCVPGNVEMNRTGSSFKLINNLDWVTELQFPDSSTCSGANLIER